MSTRRSVGSRCSVILSTETRWLSMQRGIDRTLSQCAALESYFVSEDDGKAAHRSHSLTVCSATVVLRVRG